jgi:predicted HTH transcriptional regulator
MDVALFNRKPPPFAKLHGPLGLHINFQGGDISDKTIITRSQPQSVSEFVAAMGTQAEIEQLIKENTKMTNAQIQEALTLSPDNIRHALKRLKDKQKIIKLDDGSWGLNYRV